MYVAGFVNRRFGSESIRRRMSYSLMMQRLVWVAISLSMNLPVWTFRCRWLC